MGKDTRQCELRDCIEWAGQHELLDTAKVKKPLESTLLRSSHLAPAFRIEVSASAEGTNESQRRFTLHIYLKRDDSAQKWITLEGLHDRGWIPRFAESTPETLPHPRTPA